MSQPAVLFEGVWKKFRRGERHDSLRDLIPALARRPFTRQGAGLDESEFWAIRDVSLSVDAGEALGIIGPNGAGKSTILKLLTRILRPTRGTCSIKGRAGTLIEIAAGFHPDLTGRENVYLQGAIMGMKQAEIARKFDQIVAFGGVEDFIDTPVKRYSSGMNARLGFAIAAHLDPDVLLIDEVLSVGDASFQDRCVNRMRELVGAGAPLVFISHNLPAVLDLCTRVIVMDHGRIVYQGDPGPAIQHYRLSSASSIDQPSNDSPIRLTTVRMLGKGGDDASIFRTDGEMTLRVGYSVQQPIEATFHVDIHRADGVHCAGFNNFMDRHSLGILEGDGCVDISLSNLPLLPGSYMASIWVLDAQAIRAYQKRLFAFPFSVAGPQHGIGLMHVHRRWTVHAGRCVSHAPETAGVV
jgi:lipopolysaccharide transport system ATP-binding protein